MWVIDQNGAVGIWVSTVNPFTDVVISAIPVVKKYDKLKKYHEYNRIIGHCKTLILYTRLEILIDLLTSKMLTAIVNTGKNKGNSAISKWG